MNTKKLLTHPIMYYKKKWYNYKYRHGAKIEKQIVKKEINGVQFLCDFNLNTNHIKKIYYGAYEIEAKETMKRFLNKGGTFFDIGANIGYLTMLGASLVGTEGKVHCFEPVPKYFDYISDNIKLNPDFNIVANNFALGEKRETAKLNVAKVSNMGTNSMVDGFLDSALIEDTLSVQVERFDNYIKEHQGLCPSFIKIDVEGFEISVLKGMKEFFQEHKKKLPPILVEITPRIYNKQNRNIAELEEFMFNFGYRSYCFLGNHAIDLKKITKQQDVLFKQP